MPSFTDAIVVAVLVTSAALAWNRSKASAGAPLPPGPPRHWLLGNLKDFPRSKIWLQLSEWADQYGPVMSLSLPGGKTIVVLQTLEAMNDLLDKRGALYSDRPETVMANELMGFSSTVTLKQDGPVLRRYRKLCRMALGTSAAERYEPVQQDAVTQFVNTMVETHTRRPHEDAEFLPQIRLAAIRSIMGLVYGIQVDDASHEHVKNAEASIAFFAKALQPGRYLVDIIHILKYVPAWFPFAGFQREAREAREVRERQAELPFRHVVEEMATGRAPPSFVSLLLSDMSDTSSPDAEQYEPEDIKQVARSMYNAGVDTTNSTLCSFVAAMLMHPNVQTLAQAEVDGFYGGPRKSQFATPADRAHLPYVNAVINETLRWQPAVALGIPHRIVTTQDDVYKGYLIPRGSTIIPNIWNVSRTGPDKDTLNDFDPARYLDDSRRPLDPSYVFGFGRRVCVGQLVAENFIFMMVVAILSSFTVLPALDADGEVVTTTVEWTGAMANTPIEFRCRLVPRT
ncbi:cytochrome P450 [Exidia glandulosa HHB12029]|uniref:Cytochrome P450 n=1 Tax=Exidia glandulosa HHB12029 TaxID=1314781 RepID=A0A165JIS6_EXIGL|nr:cytochrome P450 [Exidia glandulosa HHB12029]